MSLISPSLSLLLSQVAAMSLNDLMEDLGLSRLQAKRIILYRGGV